MALVETEDKTLHDKEEQRDVSNVVVPQNRPILTALSITTSAAKSGELHVFDIVDCTQTSTFRAVSTEKTRIKHELQDRIFPAV